MKLLVASLLLVAYTMAFPADVSDLPLETVVSSILYINSLFLFLFIFPVIFRLLKPKKTKRPKLQSIPLTSPCSNTPRKTGKRTLMSTSTLLSTLTNSAAVLGKSAKHSNLLTV